MLAPQIGCSTFGSWDFIRVPAPAARMTTAAGRLTVTWRCSLIGWRVGGRSPPRLGHDRSRGADETVHMPDPRRIPSGTTAGGRVPGGMTGITLPCVIAAAARAGNGEVISKVYLPRNQVISDPQY